MGVSAGRTLSDAKQAANFASDAVLVEVRGEPSNRNQGTQGSWRLRARKNGGRDWD